VPVKDLARAKSRLRPPAGTSREALALAVAQDTLRVAGALPGVEVVLVTDDARVARLLNGCAHRVVADAPVGLNAALQYAAERVPAGPLAALTADLPALRETTLRGALDAAAATAYAVVPDAAGTGTTLLAAAEPARFRPRFGPGSRDAHEQDGARVLDAEADLRRDVDTVEDLLDARRLGVGPATAALLAVVFDGCTW
jgi:2-phospho-L-lactate guanylyltransferase